MLVKKPEGLTLLHAQFINIIIEKQTKDGQWFCIWDDMLNYTEWFYHRLRQNERYTKEWHDNINLFLDNLTRWNPFLNRELSGFRFSEADEFNNPRLSKDPIFNDGIPYDISNYARVGIEYFNDYSVKAPGYITLENLSKKILELQKINGTGSRTREIKKVAKDWVDSIHSIVELTLGNYPLADGFLITNPKTLSVKWNKNYDITLSESSHKTIQLKKLWRERIVENDKSVRVIIYYTPGK